MIKVGLYGKRYMDTIYRVEQLNVGTTNASLSVEYRKGGMYNMRDAKIPDMVFVMTQESESNAVIISDQSKSKRTSIVHSGGEPFSFVRIPYSVGLDWLHVVYLDDIRFPEKIDFSKTSVSADFCTEEDRAKYNDYIDKCIFVFDSRERKHLYKNVETKTPIIFHDQFGSECVVNKKVILKKDITPYDNLHVNGAGDVFAGYFIKEYLTGGIKRANALASELTTNYLIK